MLKFSIALAFGLLAPVNICSLHGAGHSERGFAERAKTAQLVPVQQPDRVALKLGDVRPALAFQMLSGAKTPTWQALEGQVVVIDFWATWCMPCIKAIPRLNELDRQFKTKGVTFISVSYEPANYIRQFLKDHPIDADVGIDDTLDTFRNFQAWGIPVMFVFDRSGRLISTVHPNEFTPEVLSAALRGEIPNVKQAKPWSEDHPNGVDPRTADEFFQKNQRELKEKYPPGQF
jgi:thiol-disulfide isomerase/thioredoxin